MLSFIKLVVRQGRSTYMNTHRYDDEENTGEKISTLKKILWGEQIERKNSNYLKEKKKTSQDLRRSETSIDQLT